MRLTELRARLRRLAELQRDASSSTSRRITRRSSSSTASSPGSSASRSRSRCSARTSVRPRRRDLVRLAWIAVRAVLGGSGARRHLGEGEARVVQRHGPLPARDRARRRRARHAPARASEPRRAAPRRSSRRARRCSTRAVYVLDDLVVLVLGTLVTAAGPHGGDARSAPARLAARRRRPRARHRRSTCSSCSRSCSSSCSCARTRPRRVLDVGVAHDRSRWSRRACSATCSTSTRSRRCSSGFHVFGAVLVFVVRAAAPARAAGHRRRARSTAANRRSRRASRADRLATAAGGVCRRRAIRSR